MNPLLEKLFSSNALCDILPYYANFCSVKKRDKEITESMGCLRTLQDRYSKEDFAGITVLVSGDGILPRTASVISHFTEADTFSIDPEMRTEYLDDYFKFKEKIGRPVRRMTCLKSKFENSLPLIKDKLREKVILLMPHSHAPFEESVARLNKIGVNPDVINLPCCKKMSQDFLNKRKFERFRDEDSGLKKMSSLFLKV